MDKKGNSIKNNNKKYKELAEHIDSNQENKESEVNKDKETNKKQNKKSFMKNYQNKLIITIISLMIIIFLIMFSVPYIKHNYFDKFTYLGLDFQKTQLGNLIFYSTSVPVTNSEGTEVTGEYSMQYNRRDPRKLDNIDIQTPYKKILFKKNNNTVFIAIDPYMKACDDNTIALSNLAGFLNSFARFEVESGVSDKEYANFSNMSYITCDTYPESVILSITSGSETTIRKRGGNCYILTYKDCEIIDVTEKFIWVTLEDYMKNFKKVD